MTTKFISQIYSSFIIQHILITYLYIIIIKLKLTVNNSNNKKNTYIIMQCQQRQNIQPNNCPQLYDLIRDNIQYQQNQNIKNILYKQSLVKISLDKDFQHIFNNNNNDNTSKSDDDNINNLVQVTNQIKQICNWLEQSQQFKGMAYIPYNNVHKLLQILHQKIQSTAIIVTDYHSIWLQKMQQLARLYKIKWAFLNSQQSRQQKIKVLQLYEMKKIKLFFITPGMFKNQQYLDFHCDILVGLDLQLYVKSEEFLNKIIEKCNPGRFLGLYSTLLSDYYTKSGLQLMQINNPNTEKHIFISLKTQIQQKFKTLINYLQKNQNKRTLLLVHDKFEASSLSKLLKLKSTTSLNIFQYLSINQIDNYNPPQILYHNNQLQLKILDIVQKSKNYQITISKYFDALKFANYDCIVFYNFIDVPHFMSYCPDIEHRLILLCQQDYYKIRNQITSQYITTQLLTKIVTKIMQKPRKRQNNVCKKFYSDYVDDKLLDVYEVNRNYIQKNQQKVIKINWFCKNYEINYKALHKVIEGLCKNYIVMKDCKLVYEIEIQQQSINKFRKMYPQAIQVRRRINLLNLSASVQKTTRILLQQLKKQGISYKITQKALQLKIIKNYDEVDWIQLWKTVNKSVTDSALDLDKSYQVYKQCSYGSVELTRRQKYLQRKKQILNFYLFQEQKQSNILESSHKSNLLTSQIQQWIRHSNQGNLDQHQLILLLQGIQVIKTSRYREEPIFGRYKKYKYQDLSQVVQRIYKQKKIKR